MVCGRMPAHYERCSRNNCNSSVLELSLKPLECLAQLQCECAGRGSQLPLHTWNLTAPITFTHEKHIRIQAIASLILASSAGQNAAGSSTP